MNAGAFSDEAVVKASEGLIRIVADKDRDGKIFEKYGVDGMPTLLFLDPEGNTVGELGDRSAGAVKKQFDDIVARHTRGPAWMESADTALKAGKNDSKPVALVFVDDKPKSAQFIRTFGNLVFTKELLEKIAFAKVPFEKDSEICKKWKVTDAPVLLVIDNTGDEPKVLKTIKSETAKSIKGDLEDAVKKVQKKP